MINGAYGQSWSEQQLSRDDARNVYGVPSRHVCRPAQPLRLGDSFRYATAASHDDSSHFRRRQQQRAKEARNAQPA